MLGDGVGITSLLEIPDSAIEVVPAEGEVDRGAEGSMPGSVEDGSVMLGLAGFDSLSALLTTLCELNVAKGIPAGVLPKGIIVPNPPMVVDPIPGQEGAESHQPMLIFSRLLTHLLQSLSSQGCSPRTTRHGRRRTLSSVH